MELGCKYALEGADELVYLDISATVEERRTFTHLVERITAAIDIPLTVGGGIASLINSAAILNPSLVDDIAARYGSDAVVAAIDGKLAPDGTWRVTTHGGNRISDRELFAWAREVEARGAGQILFTSMEHDGTRRGYPVELFAALADTVSIPIIASGGAGSVADIAEVLTAGRADAALAASIFHYGEIPIPTLKRELRALGIEVRI